MEIGNYDEDQIEEKNQQKLFSNETYFSDCP